MGERFNRWVLSIALRRFLRGAEMGKILTILSGYKTYLAGGYGALTGLLALIGVNTPATPAMSRDAAIQLVITSLLGIFIRHGVATSTGK